MSDDPFNTPEPDLPFNTGAPTPGGVPIARPLRWTETGFVPIQPSPMLLMDQGRGVAWIELAVFVLAAIPLVFIASMIVAAALGAGLVESEQTINLAVTMVTGLLAVVCVWAIVRTTRGTAAGVGLGSRALGIDLLFGILAVIAAFAVFYAVSGVIYLVYPAGFASLESNPQRIKELVPRMHPAAFLALSLWVGFYEELVFRGFLLTRLRRALGHWWAAILVSSALFASLHVSTQQPITAVPLLGVAVVWAVFTVRRRSLVPGIVAHALFDFIQFVGLYYLQPFMEQQWPTGST
jgi:membrane protease YdiL (CAAX protease family)